MDLQGQNGLMRTYLVGYRNRNAWALVIAAALVGFYCLLYFTPSLDGIAQAVGLRSRWYLYGALYSVAMGLGAVRYLKLHGNSRYNRYRIAVNVGVQVSFAFSVPFVLGLLQQPEVYLSYLWPLDIYKLYPSTLTSLPFYLAAYAVIGSLVVAPLLAIVLGKRWYCSWVCGCGGLANTFGDPWRHLTNSSDRSWRFEKAAVHSVLVLAVVTTVLVGFDSVYGKGHPTLHAIVNGGSFSLKQTYGLVVGSILAGVVGTGLYPLFGPRVWCRNFCPMAAVLGLTQKLGRFRIRVKPDMCISCGNCTVYCEMGIDVRAYAQRNESFTRASCVGCGMCAHVCPRGVLRLENAPRKARARSLPVVSN